MTPAEVEAALTAALEVYDDAVAEAGTVCDVDALDAARWRVITTVSALVDAAVAQERERVCVLEQFIDFTVRGWLTHGEINAHAGCDSAICVHARAYGDCYDAIEAILAQTTIRQAPRP